VTERRNKRTQRQGRTTEFPRLLGERLCLHFANTVEGPRSDRPVEFLASYDDLARWCWHAGALEAAEADRLQAVARARPAEAAAAFARALELRDAIADVFGSVARSESPHERGLARLQGEYASALGNAHFAPSGGAFAWSWDRMTDELEKPLWLVAVSAVDLLTEGELGRVKECPGAGDCGWLFYDTSRNGTRRWCSMEGCGSRVKMRRQYARRRPQ
jgi:predicted RNA-binding Zn ribbon-like protein